MSKKSEKNEKFKSKIGGQALIEGVMMRGIDTSAMACRMPDGSIDVETWKIRNGKTAPWYLKTPFIRGCFNFAYCPNLTLTVPRNSYAAEYAKANNIPYTYPDANDWLNN